MRRCKRLKQRSMEPMLSLKAVSQSFELGSSRMVMSLKTVMPGGSPGPGTAVQPAQDRGVVAADMRTS
jgi:hypothetical protein